MTMSGRCWGIDDRCPAPVNMSSERAGSRQPRAARGGSAPQWLGMNGSTSRERRRQGLVDILCEVLERLEADREAQHAVADPELGAGGRLQALVRRRRRVRDDALGIAEVVRDLD